MFDNKPLVPGTGSGIVPGNTPQRPNEGDLKRVWYIDQIFDPDVHPVADMAKYIVPYEGELVHDVPNKRMLEVKHVDKYATWKTTFANYFLLAEKTDSDYDLFPQHEYGFLQGELALAIDYEVRPAVARVDANAVAPDAAYALLYKGNTIGDKGQIISASYTGQDFIDNKISVTPIVLDNLENKVIMGCNSFSVQLNKEELKNGTRCTLVYYDAAGRPIPPTYPVVVQQCAYLRDHQLSRRYVKSVELVSPWFTNSTKPNTLFIPINLPLKQVEFRARVHYNDGSVEEQPVNSFNGTSGFTLHGIDQYKPTTPGQVSEAVVLTYVFKEHEQALIAQPGQPNHISEVYEIVATPSKGAYSPRMYIYPYWTAAAGWQFKGFLTDLERKYCRDVTDIMVLNDASPVFQGQKYGEEQSLIFNLNMRDVSAIYEPWAFVQHVTITLYNPGNAVGRKWDVRHSYSRPPFSNMNLEYWTETGGVNKSRFGDVADDQSFLDKGYWAFEPMLDPRAEVLAPAPTHFDIVRVNGTSRTAIPIAEWNNLPLANMALNNGEGIYIRWTRRDATGTELQLGVSAAVCKLITAP